MKRDPSQFRILQILGSVNPESGGPIEGILQQNIACKVKNLGSIEIISLDHPDAPYLKNFPIKVHAMGKSLSPYYQSSRPTVRYGITPGVIDWLRKNVSLYDAVVVNGLWNYTIFAASRVLRETKVPYFVYTHGMIDPWFAKNYPIKHAFKKLSWMLVEGPLLSSATAVLFTTEDERDSARAQFPWQKYRERVVGYGISDPPTGTEAQTRAFHARVPNLGDRRFLLFLSRIHPKKGCDMLIEAFGKVARDFPDIDLVIAGPDQIGLQAGLAAQANALGLTSRIHWPGMLMGDEKWGAFRSAEAFILPSHAENFGVVVAEALACGTPALITNKVNIWHEVENGNAGVVVDDTLAGTEDLMRRFLSMPEAGKLEMRNATRACFKKNFDVISLYQNLTEYFKSVSDRES